MTLRETAYVAAQTAELAQRLRLHEWYERTAREAVDYARDAGHLILGLPGDGWVATVTDQDDWDPGRAIGARWSDGDVTLVWSPAHGQLSGTLSVELPCRLCEAPLLMQVTSLAELGEALREGTANPWEHACPQDPRNLPSFGATVTEALA